MSICIITSENKRLSPAFVYHCDDTEHKAPIIEIDDIYDLLYNKQNITVISRQYDQYGNEIKTFNGELEKSDIKIIFAINEEQNSKDLSSVMTLSEAAKKWGLSDGSTIRKAIERGKFNQDDIKQAGDVWITTYSAMEKVFGSIKNEEEAFVLYDDFEDVYLTKLYYDYAQIAFNKNSPLYKRNMEKLNEKYKSVSDIFEKALKAIRNNQKVIIKKSRNNKVRQVISTEIEFFLYLDGFHSRWNMSPEMIKKLINDLKAIPK